MLDTLVRNQSQVIDELGEIDVVGHRVVHGGQDYRQTTVITPEVKDAIPRLSDFAPAHNPASLEGIEATQALLFTQVPMSGLSKVFAAMDSTASITNIVPIGQPSY